LLFFKMINLKKYSIFFKFKLEIIIMNIQERHINEANVIKNIYPIGIYITNLKIIFSLNKNKAHKLIIIETNMTKILKKNLGWRITSLFFITM
jgi:hypothetical protein